MTDRIQEELSEHDGKEDFLFFVPFDRQERHSLKRNVCKAHQLPFPIVVCANAPQGNAMQRKSVYVFSPKCNTRIQEKRHAKHISQSAISS
ncbi:hypothetical protein CEXT_138591 [Caerostris extrusa]|uniref:Uncharacterized protein n=1 Tax=Caerostris extrusa TaxID=172846 RepID=A0AAV4VNH8_CAEEX|nr:hypothetical protein CEXT_138591 [Caerostris extrusa]